MNPTNRAIPSAREALALATFLTAGHAAAQAPVGEPVKKDDKNKTGAEVLPDVVVAAERTGSYRTEALSSQKFTAPLLDTPQTFTVIPEAVYKQQAATNLADVLKNTPGISYNAGENGFAAGSGTSFNMRGFESSNNIFIDGARDHGNYNRDIFNIESVEVAKGPAADNGRGGAGGYVNLVTKTPTLTDFYAGSVSYGFDEGPADSRFRTTFDVNQTVKESPVEGTAFRLNALFQDGGVAGRDYAEKNTWGIAPSLTLGLGTPTRLSFAYQYLEINDIPDYGVPAKLAGLSPTTATGLPFVSPADNVNRNNFYGRTSDFDDINTHSFLARFEHDFASGIKLSNQIRVTKTDRYAIYTIPWDVTPLPPATPTQVDTRLQANDRQTTTFSNTTNAVFEFETGFVKHTLSTGLEIAREESDSGRQFSNLGTANNTDIYHPDPSRPRPAGTPVPTVFDSSRVDTAAVYAYNTAQLNSQWQLNGGVRVEHYDAEVKSSDPAFADYSTDDVTFSGKLGVVYKPVETGSIYAAAGIAAQPPGGEYLSNSDASRTGNPLPTGTGQNSEDSDTQESINYELGTKWDFFNKRLSTTAALFHSQRDNIAFTNAGETELSYGDQTVYGLELGVAGSVTENWSIFAGTAFMENETQVGDGVDTSLAFAPRWTGNLFSTYRFAEIGLTVGGGLQYVGVSDVGRPSNTGNGSPGATASAGDLPDYIVFNALVAYEVTDNVSLRLNVDNIFDEHYATSANYPGRRAFLGAPRSYTISADWKF